MTSKSNVAKITKKNLKNANAKKVTTAAKNKKINEKDEGTTENGGMFVFLNDQDISQQAKQSLLDLASNSNCLVMGVASQGDNVKSCLDLLGEFSDGQSTPYFFQTYERQRVRGGGETGTKSRFYGPDGCMENKFDLVFVGERGASAPQPRINSARVRGCGGDAQSCLSKGAMAILDNFCDHVFLKNIYCVAFDYDLPESLKREHNTIILHSQTGELLSQAARTKKNLPSTARVTRRYKAALRLAPLKVLKKHQKDVVKYFKATQNQAEGGGDPDPLPPALSRLFGTATPALTPQDVALYKRLVSIRKKANDTAGGGTPTTPKRTVTRENGIHEKKQISEALESFLVDKCGIPRNPKGYSRVDVSKGLPKYIKQENLSKGKDIYLDDRLKDLFDLDVHKTTFFAIQKHVSPHFIVSSDN